MDYIWLLIVALGVISSIMNKGKSKSKDNPSGMPTFSGTGEGSLDPKLDTESNNTYGRTLDGNRTQQSYSMTGSDDSRVMNIPTYESEYSSSLDYRTGEGTSQMWDDSGSNQLSNSSDVDAYATSDGSAKKLQLTGVAQQAVNGVIWSEILGPPRSRNAFNKRKL